MRKQRKKRLLPFVGLCLVTAGILTVSGTKVSAAEQYEIYVAGVQVTGDNAGDVLSGTANAGKVSYDPVAKTLALNGADITAEPTEAHGILDIGEDGVTIELHGQNKITAASEDTLSFDAHPVHSSGALTLRGASDADRLVVVNGINAEEASDPKGWLYAIRCEGALAFENCNVTAEVTGSSKLSGGFGGDDYCNAAVYAKDTLSVTGGSLTAKISARVSQRAYAIYAGSDMTVRTASVTASNTSTEALENATVSGNYGINCEGSLNMSGSEVKAEGEGRYGIYGIMAEGGFVQNGGSCSAVVGSAEDASIAIVCPDLDQGMTVEGGSITAEAGNAGGMSAGIQAVRLEMKSGSIRARGGKASGAYRHPGFSCGLGYVTYLFMEGGSIDAQGGEAYACVPDASDSIDAYSPGISCGIHYMDMSGVWNIKGGSIRAQGGAAYGFEEQDIPGESYGIYAVSYDDDVPAGDITIGGGTVEAAAGTAGRVCALNKAPVYDGYEVTVKAGSNKAGASVIEPPAAETYRQNAYVSIEPYVHAHAWADTWTTDETHHWRVCTRSRCDITGRTALPSYAAHVYDDAYDADCNVCGAKRTVPARPDAPSDQIVDGTGGTNNTGSTGNNDNTNNTGDANNTGSINNTGVSSADTAPAAAGTKDNEPKTGDPASAAGALALLALSGAVMIYGGVRQRTVRGRRR